MAKIRNLTAPAADPFGHTWATADDVVDVPDEQAVQLLRLPHGGWREVLPEGADDKAGPAEDVPPTPCPTCNGTGIDPRAGDFLIPVAVAGSVVRAPGSLAGELTNQPDMRATTAPDPNAGAPRLAATVGEVDMANQVNNGLGHLTPDGTIPIVGAGPIPGDAVGPDAPAVSPEVVAGEMTERVEIDAATGEPVKDDDDPEAERSGNDADDADEAEREPYDPEGKHDPEVLDYLRSDDVDEAEVNRVLDKAAGPSGRARKGLTRHREELLQAKRERAAAVTE